MFLEPVFSCFLTSVFPQHHWVQCTLALHSCTVQEDQRLGTKVPAQENQVDYVALAEPSEKGDLPV